ncbi:MAG: hypothetical protein HWD59_10500 [Coxiellaceae bacterium]|nr:MAG: hypothetical protein HWD59_10500 [Coxiellaceae bacterium]
MAQPGQFSSFSIAHANLYSLPLLLSSQTNWILNHENYTANNSNELCCIIYNQEREQYSTYKIHTNQNNFILSAHRNNRQNIELWPTMPIGNGIEDNIVGILTPDGKLIKSDQELSEYVLAARKSKSTSTTELIYLFLATLFTSGFIFMILRWIWPDPKVVVPDNIAETTTQPIPPADEPFDLDILKNLNYSDNSAYTLKTTN